MTSERKIIVFIVFGVLFLVVMNTLISLSTIHREEVKVDEYVDGYPIVNDTVTIYNRTYHINDYKRVRKMLVEYSFSNPEICKRIETSIVTNQINIPVKSEEVPVKHIPQNPVQRQFISEETMKTLEYYYKLDPYLFNQTIVILEYKKNDSKFIEKYKEKVKKLINE